jgi:hypothetical protein
MRLSYVRHCFLKLASKSFVALSNFAGANPSPFGEKLSDPKLVYIPLSKPVQYGTPVVQLLGAENSAVVVLRKYYVKVSDRQWWCYESVTSRYRTGSVGVTKVITSRYRTGQ